MNQIKGLSRHQVAFGSLEDSISAANPVRVIDTFVDKLDLNQLGFIQKANENTDSKKDCLEGGLAEL